MLIDADLQMKTEPGRSRMYFCHALAKCQSRKENYSLTNDGRGLHGHDLPTDESISPVVRLQDGQVLLPQNFYAEARQGLYCSA